MIPVITGQERAVTLLRELSPQELLARSRRIKPMSLCQGIRPPRLVGMLYLRYDDPSHPVNRARASVVEDQPNDIAPVPFATVKTYHFIRVPDKFNPTFREFLAQIPEEHLAETAAYEIPSEHDATEGDYQVATMKLYHIYGGQLMLGF